MRRILATYHVQSSFSIPDNLKLLSNEENDKVEKGINHPFSWWIKYDTLHYYDKDGEEHEITTTYAAHESDYKRPNETEDEEDETCTCDDNGEEHDVD